MALGRGKRPAFGKPGVEPKWTHGNKDGVGTAYSGSSRLWFTIFRGVVTEVFYPTIDRPQLRDIQYMTTDGKTFVHEEIVIERSWYKGRYEPPKTPKSQRTVGVPDEIMERLNSWIANLPVNGPTDCVFPSTTLVTPI